MSVDAETIAATWSQISPYLRRTPVIDPGAGSPGPPGSLCLKLELLQHAGSFKPRGAFASLLAEPVPPVGVVCASGGNHGIAVGYAARRLGHRATVFLPTTAPEAKQRRIRATGAVLRQVGREYAEALEAATRFGQEEGALAVHAYDARPTIAGQGTVGLEWEQQARLDTVLVAVGGGGLIAGIAAWYAGRVRVIGVEPTGIPTLHAALAAGHPVDVDIRSFAADSLGARRVGELVLPIAQRHVQGVLRVSDAAIRRAMAWLREELQLVVEAGGATALAALLERAYQPEPGERVGVLICGGNVH